MMPARPSFQALDTDHDAVLSAEEIAAAPAALKTLDKNADGKLTEDEVRPQFGGRGPGGPGGREGFEGRQRRGDEPGETAPPSADDMVATLMAFDKNGDGKLAKDELPERMQGLFARADTNQDGILTADEIRKSAQTTAAPAGRGRGPEGGRGGERPNFMRMDPILAALDSDGNGEISPAEIAAAPTALKKLDKDGDGRISADEARPQFGGPRGERGPRREGPDRQ